MSRLAIIRRKIMYSKNTIHCLSLSSRTSCFLPSPSFLSVNHYLDEKLSPLVFHLGSIDFNPPLGIIWFNPFLILASIIFWSSLLTLYAWLRWLTFASLALPSLLAPALDDTYSKGSIIFFPYDIISDTYTYDFS